MDEARDITTFLDAEGGLDLAVLEAAVADEPIDVGRLTDEELHWLRDVEEVPDDDLEAPRLGKLDPASQQAALDATLFLLLARGELQQVRADDAPRVVEAVGRHALLAELREAPLGALRSRVDTRDTGPSFAAAYHVTDLIVLLEDVDPLGVHAFRLVAPRHAAAWLVRRIDPGGDATTTHPPVQAPDLDRLGVDLDAVLEVSTSVGLIDVAHLDGVETRHLAVSTYAGVDGVHRLQGWEASEPGEGQVTYQRLGADATMQLARQLIEDALRPRRLAR